jgi:hypothetical protein
MTINPTDCMFALLVSCLALPSMAEDQAPNLFKEVNPNLEEKLKQRNAEYIEDHTYFSKRFRILRGSQSVLKKLSVGDRVRLNLFADLSLDAVIARKSDVAGSIAYSLDLDNNSEIFATLFDDEKQMLKMALRSSLIMSDWYVDADSGGVSRQSETVEVMTPEGTLVFHKRKQFHAIAGDIRSLVTKTKYSIMSLPGNPKYLLVSEIDPDKFFQLGHGDNLELSHEVKTRFEAHKQHKARIKEKYKNTPKPRATEEPK